MRTLEEYIKNIEISFKSDGIDFVAEVEVVVKYNRHLYKFISNNCLAYYRMLKKNFVNDKVRLYGYTHKSAYEEYYKEFAKLHKQHSDKLAEIIR